METNDVKENKAVVLGVYPMVDTDLAALLLTHPRRKAIKCWNELLLGCETLSCFLSRVDKYAKIIAAAKSQLEITFYDKFGPDGANCFKGDVGEVFAEYVLRGWGRFWGIYNYRPFFSIDSEEQDVGVDGLGMTKDGRAVTIQIKRGNWTENLDYTHRKLRTFHWTSIRKYGVGAISKDQMFVFTLAYDVNWRTTAKFHKRLKFIDG